MDARDIAKLLREAHNPKGEDDGGMVYIVFADGEVVLTKGGELFGQRTLHQECKPFITQRAVENFTPLCKEEGTAPRVLGYAGAIVATREDAMRVRASIAEWVKEMIGVMVAIPGFGGITP